MPVLLPAKVTGVENLHPGNLELKTEMMDLKDRREVTDHEHGSSQDMTCVVAPELDPGDLEEYNFCCGINPFLTSFSSWKLIVSILSMAASRSLSVNSCWSVEIFETCGVEFLFLSLQKCYTP